MLSLSWNIFLCLAKHKQPGTNEEEEEDLPLIRDDDIIAIEEFVGSLSSLSMNHYFPIEGEQADTEISTEPRIHFPSSAHRDTVTTSFDSLN